MARGGYRAGAGRRKGAPNKTIPKKEKKLIEQGINPNPKPKDQWITPLEHMLGVINDVDTDNDRRDKMAIAAAPYVHERAAEKKLGKKEQQVEDAKNSVSIFSVKRGGNLQVVK